MNKKYIYNGLYTLAIVFMLVNLYQGTNIGEGLLWPLALISFAIGYMVQSRHKKELEQNEKQ